VRLPTIFFCVPAVNSLHKLLKHFPTSVNTFGGRHFGPPGSRRIEKGRDKLGALGGMGSMLWQSQLAAPQ